MITFESDHARALGVRPSVSAVIFDRRRHLLLQQRSDGGQVELGESVRDAVVGEVWEEAGLRVARARRVAAFVR